MLILDLEVWVWISNVLRFGVRIFGDSVGVGVAISAWGWHVGIDISLREWGWRRVWVGVHALGLAWGLRWRFASGIGLRLGWAWG